MNKRGLGRGLSALLPSTDTSEVEAKDVVTVSINKIIPNPHQPRSNFNQEGLEELAASIKEHGVVQPIAVRVADKKFELIVGERRWRAAKIAGLEEIPAVILTLDDRQMAEVALIENIQREDLNPMEEAYAFHRLVTDFNLTQEELAQRVGKSRSFIANMIRLIKLPPLVQEMVRVNKLSAGHARCILSIDSPQDQSKLIDEILDKQLSVRQTENIVKSFMKNKEEKNNQTVKRREKLKLSPILMEIEEQMRQRLGTKVSIKPLEGKKDKGKIEINYYSDDDLERIREILIREL